MTPLHQSTRHQRRVVKALLIAFTLQHPVKALLLRPTLQTSTARRSNTMSLPKIHQQCCSSGPHRSGRTLLRTPVSLHTTTSTLHDGFEWEVGDVYKDLDRLEQAINLSQAEPNLQYAERIEMLQHFAKQRRLIVPDMIKFIVVPGVASILLAALFKSTSAPLSQLSSPIQKWTTTAWNVHFMAVCVVAPCLLFCYNKLQARATGQDNGPPAELEGLDPEYFRFLTMTNWQDPKTSCTDYILCLSEQWVSAVAGFAVLGPLIVVSPLHYWRQGIQVVVRLAVVAALHQYPKLLFQLNRTQQPRPLSGRVWFTQLLVASQVVPWAVAADLSQLLATCRWSTLGVASVGLAGAWAALVRGKRIRVSDRLRKRWNSLSSSVKLLQVPAYAFLVGYTWTRLRSMYSLWTPTVGMNAGDLVAWSLMSNARAVKIGLAVTASLVGPVCHVFASSKLFRIMFTHDVSLDLETQDFVHKVEDPEEKERRYQWRYRLVWREPKRILATLEDWRKRFWFWFFFSGGVQDKLRREFRGKRESEAKRRGLTVWQRIEEDQLSNPGAPIPDRTQWKKDAMDRLARKHQKDYDKKTFEDPLGVAVHQTFGIGLGFNFDHMSKPNEEEGLSTRRLQARAAKSAIKRAQEIYDASAALSELDDIDDAKERRRRAAEMRKKADDEIKYLADRLSELIPTDLSLDDRKHTRIQQYAPTDYVRTSSKEYAVRSPRVQSDAITNLLRPEPSDDDVDYLNPAGVKLQDDEFVDEWIKRNQSGKSDVDDDDDDTKQVLA